MFRKSSNEYALGNEKLVLRHPVVITGQLYNNLQAHYNS